MIPYLRAANVKDGQLILDDVLEMNFTPEEQTRFGLRFGDVLVTEGCGSARELGASARWQSDLAGVVGMQNTLLRLRAIPGVSDDRYLAALAQWCHRSGRWLEVSSGASILHIGLHRAKKLMAPRPPLDVQQRIGAVLGAIDDLIENNRRRVALLEQMAQAIYREWFVHFRYPGYEDDELVDSPLGPIPAGWDVREVAEVATIVRGRSYRKSELVESGGVPFINLKCMERGGGFRRDGLKRYAGPFKPEQESRPGDIVLAVTDLTQGREILARATLVPPLSEGSGVISLDVVRVVPNEASDRIPLFALLRYSDLADRVKEFANGSTVLHLSPDHVGAAPILWPLGHIRRRLADALGPNHELCNALGESIDRLAALRDLLLPKLVTGAIDVSHLDLDNLLDDVAA